MAAKPLPVVEVNIRPGPPVMPTQRIAWDRLWQRLITPRGKNEGENCAKC